MVIFSWLFVNVYQRVMVSLPQTSHHIWIYFITTSQMDLAGMMVNV